MGQIKNKFLKKIWLAITILSLLCLFLLNISFAVKFNANILKDLGYGDVDLSAFSGSSTQYAGEYRADIVLNDKDVLISDWPLHFYQDNGESIACITPTLLTELPLKKSVLNALKNKEVHISDNGACLPLATLDSMIKIDFDDDTQRLNLTLPHLFLDNYDPNWIPPRRRDHGISGLFVDYSLIMSHERRKNQENSNNIRSIGSVGMNIGRFRFRSNYQYDNKNRFEKKFEWTQTYGFVDIGSLNAKLYAGEIYTRSNVFDSTRIKGFSLFTDSSMMPSYLQGYAPQVTGTANTNATVTVRQYGRIITTVQVPPGPFEISDLPSYITGTIDVEIEEQNGSIRHYQMEIAQVPFLTRKGTSRYAVNIGRLDSFRKTDQVKATLISADGSYGISNNISIFGGATLTTDQQYQAYNAGIGANIGSFGAISVDVTHSINKANNFRELKGYSYRFNYAKRFDSSTNINLVGSRTSSQDYTTLNDFINIKKQGAQYQNREKTRLTLSVSQQIDAINGSLSLSATHGRYWGGKRNENYNASYSTTVRKGLFQNTSIQLSMARNRDYTGRSENMVSLFVTIPIGSNYDQRIQYNAAYYSRDKMVSQGATYYANAWGGTGTVSARANHKRNFSGNVDYGFDASYNKDFSLAKVQTTASYEDNSQRVMASIDSSITLTRHGIATHPRVYENGARLLVNTGTSGVVFEDGYTKSNIFGIAGISNIPTYSEMTYAINNDKLPENVDITNGIIKLAVSEGAIAYRSSGAITGEKVVAVISLPDGSHPPFGAVVYRESGDNTEVAMIAGDGLTYLTGINKKDRYIIKWGATQCSLVMNGKEDLDSNGFYHLTCNMEN